MGANLQFRKLRPTQSAFVGTHRHLSAATETPETQDYYVMFHNLGFSPTISVPSSLLDKQGK
jgi:hypothetical protein